MLQNGPCLERGKYVYMDNIYNLCSCSWRRRATHNSASLVFPGLLLVRKRCKFGIRGVFTKNAKHIFFVVLSFKYGGLKLQIGFLILLGVCLLLNCQHRKTLIWILSTQRCICQKRQLIIPMFTGLIIIEDWSQIYTNY